MRVNVETIKIRTIKPAGPSLPQPGSEQRGPTDGAQLRSAAAQTTMLAMSFQAYLDTIQTKTGKTPADFAKLVAKHKLSKHGEIVAWLKAEFELGHGHANAMAAALLKGESRSAPPERKLDALFAGKRDAWRKPCEALITKVSKFGADVATPSNETYVNLLRGKKKFAILQPAVERLDIGIKLKGVAAEGRLEAAGTWNAMVTHRVRIAAAKDINAAVLAWLKQAYEAA